MVHVKIGVIFAVSLRGKPLRSKIEKMDKEYCIEIANTIKSQIYAGALSINPCRVLGIPSVVGSWGARGWIAFYSEKKKEYGLRFKVSGAKHNGFVEILLNFSDYYDITLKSNKNEVVAEFSDIDCFQLAEFLDDNIESGGCYYKRN